MNAISKTLAFAAMLASITAMSQNDQKMFRIALGSGVIAPQKVSPGFLLYVEPSVRLHNYLIGARLETAARFYADVGVVGSYTLNTQRYLSTKGNTRYFVGLGFGIYTANSAPFGYCSCGDQLKNSVVGFYPRVGVELNRFVLSMDYNIVQTAKQRVEYDVPMMNPAPMYYQASMSYISFKFGFYIGIGRKKEIK